MSETQQHAAPGWYDDGTGRQRWWDGTAWGPFSPGPSIVVQEPATRLPLNGAAVGGFIVSLIALLTCWLPGIGLLFAVLGALFSGVGMYLVKQRGTGKGIASAGTVLSVISLFVGFLMILLAVQS